MQNVASRLWFSRIVTFVVAAVAAASTAYWSLKGWGVSRPPTTPTMALAQAPSVPSQAVARALGGGLAPLAVSKQEAPVASRYALVGVIAGLSRTGAALISVDGQEARPVRVGNAVDGKLMLLSVSGRRAVLSSGADAAEKITLDLPPLSN